MANPAIIYIPKGKAEGYGKVENLTDARYFNWEMVYKAKVALLLTVDIFEKADGFLCSEEEAVLTKVYEALKVLEGV